VPVKDSDTSINFVNDIPRNLPFIRQIARRRKEHV
jgi:hypothetical protein